MSLSLLVNLAHYGQNPALFSDFDQQHGIKKPTTFHVSCRTQESVRCGAVRNPEYIQ